MEQLKPMYAWVNSHGGIIVNSDGRERFVLGKERKSIRLGQTQLVILLC